MDREAFGRVPVVARGQGGVFTAQQAEAEGWSGRQVTRRLRAGRWVRVVGRGLAAAPPARPTPVWSPYQLATAACLTLPGAVVSHHTAGGMHGFPIPGDARAHVIADARHDRVRGVTVHRLRPPDDEVEEGRGGLRITTRRRTAADLLGVLPFDDALNLWAWLASRQVMTPAELRGTVARRRRLAGTAQLRRLLDVVGDGAVSIAERRLHGLLHAAGIRGWQAGVTLSDGAGIIGVADVYFERAKVILEVDGFRAHSSRQQFVDDRRRQNRLMSAGCCVLRFTWDDLTRRPQAVVAQVLALVSDR